MLNSFLSQWKWLMKLPNKPPLFQMYHMDPQALGDLKRTKNCSFHIEGVQMHQDNLRFLVSRGCCCKPAFEHLGFYLLAGTVQSLTSALKALICYLWLLRWLLGKQDKCHRGLECNFEGRQSTEIHESRDIQVHTDSASTQKRGSKHTQASWFWNQCLASQPRGWRQQQRPKDSEAMILNYLQCALCGCPCDCCPYK